MDQRLVPQLKNSDEIKNVLRQVEVSFQLSDGRKVETLLIYLLPDAEGNSLNDFFTVIKNGIMANFVFSCTEVEKKLGINIPDAASKLFEKAIRKISQHTAHGELGELILFTLLDVYLEAPKLLSKISTKTSRRMPVFGADAVHGQFYDGKFRLMLGESKLHQDFNSAATKATESIKSAKDTYQSEFDLLDSNMDFPNMDSDLENYLLEILDPFSNIDLDEVLHSPCFIGFSNPDLLKINGDDFEKSYVEIACQHVGNYFGKIEKQGITIDKTMLILLPFDSVPDLVTNFIKYMDIKK
ncbi:hypothetical protein CBQ28_18380 [Pseudoalteromonas sp. GCY]|uniref:HamA C-terminal domain-containing protein n=1 Tax=Pseudoalteromonas sp. GCY TaxID=2003316 RepID=UPI000BFF1223|nr:DUF1837 domain-containing protein [Pseudoalteromonas sp. GCY]PHI35721.1 hypothetical protein CBQ28_18380 [Pseudoalteromonas sp. GCY]QQQ68005.1 DUF1837 domain-containing protein [Pseudoalteromonas sp. GCY]